MSLLETVVNVVAQLIPVVCYGITGYVTGRFWAMDQFRKRLHKIAATRRSANQLRRQQNAELTERNEALWRELRTVTAELQRATAAQPIDIGQAVQEVVTLRRRERRRQRARERTEATQYRRLDVT